MELWDYKTVDGITATTVLKQTITDIDNQPTVDAIPIEWIAKQRIDTDEQGAFTTAYLMLIEKWREENAER